MAREPIARSPEDIGRVRTGEERVDTSQTEANGVGVAISADGKKFSSDEESKAAALEAIRANKRGAGPEDKAKLAEARARSKFVGNTVRSMQADQARLKSAPFIGEVVMPTDERTADEAWDGQKQLKALEQAEREAQQLDLKADGEEYQYFVRCRSCYGHAIYLVKPYVDGQVLGDKDWFSRYKPDPKTQWRQTILCQACLREGTERTISIEYVNAMRGEFRPDPRWVRKVPKDPMRAAKEGSVRVCELPSVSQNVIGTLADQP